MKTKVLPDGIPMLKQKIPIWVNFGRFSKEDVGMFYDH
jgi:hypothetical protein